MDAGGLGTAALVATLLLPLVSLIKQPTWSANAKQALGLAAALVAAVIGALVDGNVNTWQEGIALLGTARLVADTVYAQFFRETQFNETLTEKSIL